MPNLLLQLSLYLKQLTLLLVISNWKVFSGNLDGNSVKPKLAQSTRQNILASGRAGSP